MPSFILIHPSIWPQYTNITDRTGLTDRWSDSIGQTILQAVAQKTKARFSDLLRHLVSKQKGPILVSALHNLSLSYLLRPTYLQLRDPHGAIKTNI